MPQDKRKEFFDKVLADDPKISDEDLSAALKVFDSQNPQPEKTNHALAIGTGVVKGAGDVTGVTPIVEAAKIAPGAISDISSNAKSGAQSLGKSGGEFVRGALSSPMGRMMTTAILPSMASNPEMGASISSLKDVQGAVDPAADTTDPWEANARRATNVLGMMFAGKLLKEKGGGKPSGGGPVGDLVDTGHTTNTGAYPQRPALIKDVPPPNVLSVPTRPNPASTGSATPMAGMRTAAPVSVESVRGGTVTGPKVSMSVGVKPKPPITPEPSPATPPEPPSKPVITPEDLAAGDELLGSREVEAQQTLLGKSNEEMKAIQDAEATPQPLGKPQWEGFERRAPDRKSGEAIDRAYKDVRKEIERKAAVEEARKRLGATKPPTPAKTAESARTETPDATPVTEEGIGPPSSTVDLNKPINMEPGKPGPVIKIGYDKPSGSPATATPVPAPTEGGGRPGNVLGGNQSGKAWPEVQARLNAGEPLEKVVQDLSKDKRAREVGKMTGLTEKQVREMRGTGPEMGRIGKEDALKIREALERKMQAGQLSAKEEALYNRIRDERGRIDLKKLLMLGGGVAGGVAGAALNDNGDPTSDQALTKTALGVLAGAAIPAAIMHPHHLLTARTEGFLSGLAIPKNILTDAAAPVTAAIEGTSTKGRMAPLKELARLPTNAKEFLSAIKHPATSNKYGKIAGPFSRTIGAIDTTGRKLLERGGVPSDEIDRLLLTKDRSLFGGLKPSPEMQGALDIAYPFQRVPANVFAETAESAGRSVGATRGKNGVEFNLRSKGALFNPDIRTALDIGATGGGVALGQWAGKDKKKLAIAQVAMAILGPRAGLGTIGMMTQVGRQAIGGISPIPEQNADVKSFVGWPPTGWKTFKKFTGGS